MTNSSRHKVQLSVMTQFTTQNAGVRDDTVQDTTCMVTERDRDRQTDTERQRQRQTERRKHRES